MTAPPMVDFDDRWKAWSGQLGTSGREADLAVEFETLVAVNPARALELARHEKDLQRRNHLVSLILLLWAESDPVPAASKAGSLPPEERREAVAAVLAGASKNPTTALQLAHDFCRKDRELSLEHGYSLVNIMGQIGKFRLAVDFAAEAAAGAESEEASKWLKAAFAQWAQRDPATAMAALHELAAPSLRFEALDALAAGRIGLDPAGLAEALRKLPPGEDRNVVLGHALRTWVKDDLKTASTWLNNQSPGAEMDAGVSAVAQATQAQMLNQRPEVALSWAESIVSPELRSQTLVAVVTKWALEQPAQARRYVESSDDLLPSDRADLLVRLSKTVIQ
ncbi:MAG: hypothetical protein QM715_21090 [Nibricoccus sp.]